MVNAATINSYIIYSEVRRKAGQSPKSKREFLKEFAKELVQPWAEHRISLIGQNKTINQTIGIVFPYANIPPPPRPEK